MTDERISAGHALQIALVRQASDIPALTGVYQGPPARASFPYLCIDCGNEESWMTSQRPGREVMAILVCWDDDPARLIALARELDNRCQQTESIDGWHLIDLRLQSRSIGRDGLGPWSAKLKLRARMLQMKDGEGS